MTTDTTGAPAGRTRIALPGISSRAWEHPTDRGALIALRRLKGFDTVLKALSGLVSERSMRLELLGSGVRVDERQFVRVHRLLADVGRSLDLTELPEVYVVADPHPQAATVGLDQPFIVLGSALVDLLDDDELRFALGHEVGHALSGHAIYRTMLMRMISATALVASVPGARWAGGSSSPACRAGRAARSCRPIGPGCWPARTPRPRCECT